MKRVIIIICTLMSCISVQAQNFYNKPLNTTYNDFWSRIKLGLHAGVDLGAAAPWPLSSAIGGGDRLTAVPKVTPSLGIVTGYIFNEKWSINTEVTYRTVGVNATIVTLEKGQNFTIDGEKVLFRGQATMSMSFSQMEVPLYARWDINQTNAVTLGLFYSYIAHGEFIASPIEGNIVSASTPDATPEPLTANSVPEQNFSSSLSNWDIGYQIGYERRIAEHLAIGGRFTMGVKDIFKPKEKYLDYSMLQMRGTLQLVYRFR
ncbi:MAG: outer membrane beta-barrel protein [Rikenellaceae bacterium]